MIFKIQYGEIYSFISTTEDVIGFNLKSSMERFIDCEKIVYRFLSSYLKSSMERFIAPIVCVCVRNLF